MRDSEIKHCQSWREHITPCCRPLIAYLQRQTGLSTAAQSNVHFTVDWLSWLCAIAL